MSPEGEGGGGRRQLEAGGGRRAAGGTLMAPITRKYLRWIVSAWRDAGKEEAGLGGAGRGGTVSSTVRGTESHGKYLGIMEAASSGERVLERVSGCVV